MHQLSIRSFSCYGLSAIETVRRARAAITYPTELSDFSYERGWPLFRRNVTLAGCCSSPLTLAPVAAGVSTPQSPTSAWSGVYLASQAVSGEKVYADYCAKCHGQDLAGIERASALAGLTFAQRWRGATLAKLYERIEAMPPEAPKSLTTKQYVDVLAFLLRANEYPAGQTPLAPDQLALVGVNAARRRGQAAAAVEWKTYGGDLASTRYSPLDQINKDNFSKLQIAWRLNTDPFGPRPDTLYSATPLMVGGVLYTTAGTRRAVVALNAATGELLWMHSRRRRTARPERAAQRRRPRRRLLVERRRIGSAHHLRDARLPDDRARTPGPACRSRPSARTASSI